MNKKLLSNTIYLYIHTAIKMVFPLLTLPYLTRVLSTDTYGVVSYVKAYISYVYLIIDFGFILSATKNISLTEDKKVIGKLVGDTLVEKLFLTIVSGLLTGIMVNTIPILSSHKVFTWIYFLSCVVSVFILDFLFRGIEKMQYVTIPYTLSKVTALALTFIMVRSESDYIWIAILELIGNLIAAAFSVFFADKNGIKLSFSSTKKWFVDIKESAVYFISNCATTALGAFTTLIMGFFLSKTDIAYWSLCMQFVGAAKSMYIPITNSIYPHMLKNKDMKLVRKIAVLFMLPLAIGCCVVLSFGEKILILVGGADYGYAGYLMKFMLPIFVASFYSMLFGWPVLGAIGKVKETSFSTVLTAVAQIVGIGLLIATNSMTLIALAIVSSVSEILFFVLRYSIYIKNRSLFGGKK